MPLPLAAVALALVTLLALSAVAVARSLAVAQPDEWLLCIRNGKLVKAGVGIQLWRWPGDVAVRFTSTVQRVGFAAGALSRERLRVTIEGFILWSVSAEGDAPFRAFRKLGLVDLGAPPRDLKSPRHLLATPQHHAFQQLLAAEVQRLAAARTLDELLLDQDGLVAGLRRELAVLEREMGIRVDEVELVAVRPADEELLRRMAAAVEERVRQAAESARLQAEARLAEERAEVRRRELERDEALRLAEIEHDREVKLREHEAERERALAAEARATEIATAVLQREELQLAARLDRMRREAEASRDAIAAVASAEEGKSQAVRDHELGRLVAEKVGDALRHLPLQEARWVTVGPDSPAGSLAALIAAARDVAASAGRRGT